MYNLDFSLIPVTLEELQAEQEAEHWSMVGDPRYTPIDRLTLSHVWKQKQIPVVLRRTGHGERLRARLPFADDNREWLQNGRRKPPKWVDGTKAYWELPKSWF